jgi:hypothetical protein
MATVSELDAINAQAMMTLSEIGFARYERFLNNAMECYKGSILRSKLKSFISDWSHREQELENRIKVAPMYEPMS